MKLLVWFILNVIVIGLFYLLFAFIELKINPLDWSIFTRIVIVIALVFFNKGLLELDELT